MIFNLALENVSEIVKLQDKNNFTDGWNEKMLIDAFNSGNYVCFGERKEGELVAFIGISLSVDTCDLEDVLVDSNHRRLGLAEKLINYTLDYAKSQHKQKMFLEVRENNSPAITLYQKLGFKKISTRKNYYSDGINALVYLKEL